jgi:hypothetical protein
MRAVTPTLAAAIEAAERVVSLDARIDWDGDGYNTIDMSDPFDRSVVDGWGANPAGYPYTLTGVGGTLLASNFQVPGTGVATHSVAVAAAARTSVILPTAVSIPDLDVTIEWSCPVPTGNDLEPAGVEASVQASSVYILCRTVVSPDLTVKAAFFHTDPTATSYVLLDPTVIPGLTYTAAVNWKTRVQARNGWYRIMVWPTDQDPPALWQAVVYDGTWATGGWAVRSGVATGNTNTKPVVFTYYGVDAATSAEDDISGKLSSLDITRDMRGQLPDDVLVVEGISAATAKGDLTAGKPTDEQLGVVRYFSRTNPASPLYGKPRDSRDAKIAVKFLTDAGTESVPRMTGGVLRALPVDAGNRSADLALIDGRDRFRAPITLPAVIADGGWDGVTIPTKPGLEASWVASYVLSRCGYPLSPRPRTECRLHIPFHGSATPFVQPANSGAPLAKWEQYPAGGNPQRVQFTDDAPFFLAATPGGSGGYIQMKAPVNAVPADGWDSNGRATGIRIEHWVKRAGTEPVVDLVVTEVYNDTLPTQSRVKFFARKDGFLAVQVINGANLYTLFSPVTYTASVWHFVGVHVDDVNGRCTFRIDGTNYLVTNTPTTAGTLVYASVDCDVTAYGPITELHVSMCAESVAWLPLNHTSGAVVDRLQNRLLSGIYPDKPVEAWTILQELVAAELGTCRIDYDGRPNVWSAARRNSPDSRNVQRTVTARQHLSELAYDDSRDMIRNLIRVPYVQYKTSGLAPVWSLTELVALGPGETQVYQVKWQTPLAGAVVTLAGNASTAASSPTLTYAFSDIAVLGVKATVAVTSPTTATITVTNVTSGTLWLVDPSGVPYMILSGTAITKVDTDPVQVQDDAAIARRGGPGVGEAPLDVDDNAWRQSINFAYGIAYGLLAMLRDEQVVYTSITIPGDPRLEMLDRIRVQDPDGLVLDTPLLLEGVDDKFPDVGYDSELVGRPARDQWLLGAAGVGTPLGSTILGGASTGVSNPDAGTDDEWDDMTTTLLVAAVDAPADVIAGADYTCDGTADDVQIQAALTAAASSGKRVQLSMGHFTLAAQINLDGADDVDIEGDIYLRGCGPSNTILTAASGATAGIMIRKVAKVHISDLRVEVGGATHGFASVATLTAGAGYRSFWLSSFKNLQVVGPFDGSHSGYGFHFDNPFRSVFENLECAGIGNGVRLYSTSNNFNPGDCTFTRCFMDLFGNTRFGYKIESTVASGVVNQIEFSMVEAIASGTGCTGIYLGGTGPVTHIKFHGVNLEQFDTLVNFNNGYGSTVDLNYTELRGSAGLNALTFGASSSGNRVENIGFLYAAVATNLLSKAGGTAAFPNTVECVNLFGDGGTISLGFAGPANTPGTDTLLRKRINNTGGTATGANVTQAPGIVNF